MSSVNELPLFLLLLCISHMLAESAGQWEVYRLYTSVYAVFTAYQWILCFSVDSSAKLTLAGRVLTYVLFSMSSELPLSYLILVASGKIPCHYESQKGEQNLLSFFVSLLARKWKSMQNYFRRKVLWRCVTPESSLFLFLWYESRSLNWSDQWKMLFEL